MPASNVLPGKLHIFSFLIFFALGPLAAEPLGAGAFSGVLDLLALLLPLSVFLLSLFPLVFLQRRLRQGVAVAYRRTVFLLTLGIIVVFSALTAGAAILAIDLATPKEIYTGDGFTKTDISWLFVISAVLSGIIVFLPVAQSIRILRLLGRRK